MSGPIVSGTPWGGRAIEGMDPEARAVIEEQIPTDHRIVVIAARTPSVWTLILRGPRGEVARLRSNSLEIGCEKLIDAASVVVERTGGYGVTAEVAS
jgi:hypothetical protein